MCMQIENLTKQIISPMLKVHAVFTSFPVKILISCKINKGHNTISTKLLQIYIAMLTAYINYDFLEDLLGFSMD